MLTSIKKYFNYYFAAVVNLTNITLLVFSGVLDPWVQVDLSVFNVSDYESMQANGIPPVCIPAKLGYKGFLVDIAGSERLFVGTDPERIRLQRLLLETIPNELITNEVRQSVSNETGTVAPQCPTRRRKRLAPPFETFLWNDVLKQRRNNNCYNYANIQITNTYAQPGKGSGPKFDMLNGVSVRDAAIRDGLLLLVPQPSALDPVPGAPAGTRHLVALFIWPG